MLPTKTLILLSLCVFAASAVPTQRRGLLHDIFDHHNNDHDNDHGSGHDNDNDHGSSHDNDNGHDSGNSNHGNSNHGNSNHGNSNFNFNSIPSHSILPAIASAIAGNDGPVNVNFNQSLRYIALQLAPFTGLPDVPRPSSSLECYAHFPCLPLIIPCIAAPL